MKVRTLNRRGSAFVVIIGILSVIIIIGYLFMGSTIEQGRQTSQSVQGLQATYLAEAALERTMTLLKTDANEQDFKTFETAKSIPLQLRLPMKEGSGSISSSLGTDKLLALPNSALVTEGVTLTKEDLQAEGLGTSLDELVEFMTDGRAESYDVKVNIKLDKAFSYGPGKEYEDYKIPGVQLPWNIRKDVENFLDGKGYVAMILQFPDSMKWFDFTINLGGGVFSLELDLVKEFDKLIAAMGIKDFELSKYLLIDTFARWIFNDVLFKGKDPPVYPFKKILEKNLKTSLEDFLPADFLATSGVSPTDKDLHFLKYGQLLIEFEASIKYKGSTETKRRISAVKDFKVADCEPIAPMYSFFVNNSPNDYLTFNSAGGQFYVNNIDHGGLGEMINKIKSIPGKIVNVFKKKAPPTMDELEKKEYPGLIRLNYKGDETFPYPMLCNVSFLGDTTVPDMPDTKKLVDLPLGIDNLFRSMEVGSIIKPGSSMVIASGHMTMKGVVKDGGGASNEFAKDKTPPSDAQAPDKLTKETGGAPAPKNTAGMTGTSFSDETADKQKNNPSLGMNMTSGLGLADVMGQLKKMAKINVVPNLMDISKHLLDFTLGMANYAFNEVKASSETLSKVPIKMDGGDSFERWEMPYFGTKNSFYTLPTTGISDNRTHFFGNNAMHPTMTREIEGNVMKVYRQWNMMIVGLKPEHRLPTPWPPITIPPFPVPIWYTKTIAEKYGYSLGTLAPVDNEGNVEHAINSYDPALLSNYPPNLSTAEQYAKKATYYYDTYQEFLDDIKNRTTKVDIEGVGEKDCFLLNGITFVADSIGTFNEPFVPPLDDKKDFYVTGKGAIVCSGNFFLGCNIRCADRGDLRTNFSLICRTGGLIVPATSDSLLFEGSLYTDMGLMSLMGAGLQIRGNWVTDVFNKPLMGGAVQLDYISSRVRTSLGSLHPERGRFEPNRYFVTFSPAWASWRVH